MDVRDNLRELVRRLSRDGEAFDSSDIADAIAEAAAAAFAHASPGMRVQVAAYFEEILLWHLVARTLESTLGQELIVPASTGDKPSTIHPLVESLAKSRERMRKVMKEALERFEKQATEENVGIADVMKDLMIKTEKAFEDAVEPSKGSKKPEASRARP